MMPADPAFRLFLEVASAQETMRAGAAVAKICAAGDLIALEGELGAGKTQFTRGLARGLGLDEKQVSSPTFVTVQEYWPEEDKGLVLVHIDAWRMSGDGHELDAIGWGADGGQLRQGAVVAVEWPGKMGPALGNDFLEVRLAHADEGKRRIYLRGFGAWQPRMQTVMGVLESAGLVLEKSGGTQSSDR